MSARSGHSGLAFVCSPDGTIARLIQDELGLASSLVPGATLMGIMDDAGAAKARTFLDVLNAEHAAFDWAMSLDVAGQPMALRFSGVAEHGAFYVVAIRDELSQTSISEELTSINNEQTNALRATHKALSLQDASASGRDRQMLEDLSRVNNELANLEREMVRKHVELEKLNTQKNRMLGMAAHDLRTPLGVIQSYSEFLEDEAGAVLNAEQREFVAVIKTTSEFMLHLITDLLDVTTIEAGQLKLDREPTDLGALIQHNVTLNRVLASRKGIAVELQPMPSLAPILLDAGKIEQVLNNLISNAVKFSNRGTTVRLTVTCSADVVTVAVTDQGPGIPLTDRSRLFKPFGKASVRSTAGEHSTGLGLAIVRNIVEGHGGRIWLDSEVGQGSTFSFTLPLV